MVRSCGTGRVIEDEEIPEEGPIANPGIDIKSKFGRNKWREEGREESLVVAEGKGGGRGGA